MRLRTPRARPSWFLFLGLSATLWAQRPGSSALGRLAPPPPAKQAASGKKANSTAKPPVPIFKDIAQQAGLTVSHLSSNEKRYVIESMSGGVGLFDCDNDGKLDIVMVNGSTVDRYRLAAASFATSRECLCNAVPGACKERAIFSSTTKATLLSRKFRRKLESATPTSTTALV